MRRVSELEASNHTLIAGPLRVGLSPAGEMRIGWDEPDWLGPAQLVAPGGAERHVSASSSGLRVESDWVVGTVRAIADEPVVVLRLEAPTARTGFGSGDFASPTVAWHFDPRARAAGGAPEDMHAFGHQYTEFALPVF